MAGSKRQTPDADEPSWRTSIRRPGAGLHLVATPIGDLADITLRGLETLRQADLIACEDTRVSGVLLRHYGIATPTCAYHEHNAAKMRPRLLARLAAGETVALVSDAGTPLISDPGYRLVAEAREQAIAVFCAPGPSAVMAALSLAGLPTDRFTFVGFLPSKPSARNATMARLGNAIGSLVLFESARRLPATLALLATGLGDRPSAVCRELTKMYEEVRRDRLPALAAHYAEAGPPRGEVVIVIGPADVAEIVDESAIDRALNVALVNMSVRDAAETVATAMAIPRRRVYGRALALSGRAEAPT